MRTSDPRIVDGAIVAGCLGLTALAVKTPWSGLPLPVVAVAGAVASVALWWRRDRPSVAAVAGAIGYLLSGNPGPLLAGLYAAGAYAPRRQAAALGVVGWGGAVGWSWVDAGRFLWADAVYFAIAAAVTVGLGVHVATRRELQDAWRERAERADTERYLRDEQARAEERDRIAREMHDVLAHKVSLIALHAGALELTAEGGADRVREGAGLIRVTAREALTELRTVLGVLQTGIEASVSVETLVADAVRAGQRVTLDDTAGELPAPVARVVRRVVQESLTNARKHALGAAVRVAVCREADTVMVTVTNPLVAGALDLPGSGAGLVGLAERIRLAGGTWNARAADGEWQVRARIPEAK